VKKKAPQGVPAYFGWRYIFFWVWSHMITVLMIVQAAFTTLTLDPTLVSHNVFHGLLIANAVLVSILAQINRQMPAAGKKK
jgi:hypothetical protein